MKQFTALLTFKTALSDVLEPENMRILATVFWRILVFVALMFIAGSVYYGFGTYQSTLSALDASASPGSARALFSRADLDAVVASFDSRALQYGALSIVPFTDEDPSK